MWRVLLLLCCLLAGCNLPRDPDHTLDRVKGGTMRVGIVPHAPWTIDSGGTPSGVEPPLVEAIARDLGATIEWVRGPEHDLLRAVHERTLPLVIGGLTADSPWKQEVAFTRPYANGQKAHVFASPPGENAWLAAVERAMERHKHDIVVPSEEAPQ